MSGAKCSRTVSAFGAAAAPTLVPVSVGATVTVGAVVGAGAVALGAVGVGVAGGVAVGGAAGACAQVGTAHSADVKHVAPKMRCPKTQREPSLRTGFLSEVRRMLASLLERISQ